MEQWEQKARAVLNLCRPEYRWIVMDENETWCVYRDKPKRKDSYGWWFNFYESYNVNCFDLDPAPDWKNSLIERSE